MRLSLKIIMYCFILSLLGGCHAVQDPKKALPSIPEQADWALSSTNPSPAGDKKLNTSLKLNTDKMNAEQQERASKSARSDRPEEKLKFSFHTQKQQQKQLQQSSSSYLKQHRQSKQQYTQHSSRQTKEMQTANQQNQVHSQVMSKQRKLTLPELRIRYPEVFKMRGSSSEKKVALTFDDVPDNTVTPVVLDILKEMDVKATFFLVGHRAKTHPALVKRIVEEGHVIGNHTYNHPLLTKAELSKFISQLKDTEQVIELIAGYKPRFFRPPFGEITEEQLKWAGDHGYLVVNWDVDSNDWRGISTKAVEQNVMSTVSSGSIVLQHAGGNGKREYLQNTIHALPSIIKKLRAQHYSFVTLPELLNDQQQKRDH